jgi:enamine deaminase RidA (YjgF/YER057c/UK114 family)
MPHALLNPAGVAPPLSAYSHGVLADPGLRWLHVSGQVGSAPDGTVPDGTEAQMRQAWANALAVLAAAGMGPDDIVKVNVFLTRPEDVPLYRAVRDEALEGRRPASTLLVVAALASPRLRVEVELVAAAPGAAAAAA